MIYCCGPHVLGCLRSWGRKFSFLNGQNHSDRAWGHFFHKTVALSLGTLSSHTVWMQYLGLMLYLGARARARQKHSHGVDLQYWSAFWVGSAPIFFHCVCVHFFSCCSLCRDYFWSMEQDINKHIVEQLDVEFRFVYEDKDLSGNRIGMIYKAKCFLIFD